MWNMAVEKINKIGYENPQSVLTIVSAMLISSFNNLMLVCVEEDVKEQYRKCSTATEKLVLSGWLGVIRQEICSRGVDKELEILR